MTDIGHKEITQIQQVLIDKGFLSGKTTGIWDHVTSKAYFGWCAAQGASRLVRNSQPVNMESLEPVLRGLLVEEPAAKPDPAPAKATPKPIMPPKTAATIRPPSSGPVTPPGSRKGKGPRRQEKPEGEPKAVQQKPKSVDPDARPEKQQAHPHPASVTASQVGLIRADEPTEENTRPD